MKPYKCDACGADIEIHEDYEPEFCCTGPLHEIHCGCMGKPINPIFCDACENKIFGANYPADKPAATYAEDR